MLDLTGVELNQALFIVVPALLIIGYALKQTPKCPDWLIIWILLGLGSIAGLIAVGFNVNGFANGVIAGGLAVTANQLFKQTLVKRNE